MGQMRGKFCWLVTPGTAAISENIDAASGGGRWQKSLCKRSIVHYFNSLSGKERAEES